MSPELAAQLEVVRRESFSLLQRMPDGRVRLNPACVPEVGAYLSCLSQKWWTASIKTLRGTKGIDRKRKLGEIRQARLYLRAIGDVINRLCDTVKEGDFYAHLGAIHDRLGLSLPAEDLAYALTPENIDAMR